MVGIVVVSHSRALARAALTLAEEMLHGRRVPIVIAAGLDDQAFGTDAVQIRDALVEADRDGDGVVVLMDLQGAVLSAEMALDLLEDDDARQRVLLCPAPLIEGLLVAAVTAQSGAGRGEVAAEALAALTVKQSHLRPHPSAPPAAALAPGITRLAGATSDREEREEREEEDGGEAAGGRFRIAAAHGLHARPAARLAQLLQGLDAQVELRNLSTESGWVPGASLSRLATLGALDGHDVEVRAAGPQAQEAVEQLLALAQRHFDDPRTAGRPARQVNWQKLVVTEVFGGPFAASPGIGIGPARLLADFRIRLDVLSAHTDEPPSTERRLLDEAITAARSQLRELRALVARETGEDDASIFDAHLALLDDPALLDGAHARIDAGQAARSAWARAVTMAVAGLEALTDPYLQARAADVRAVGDQVLSQLLGLEKDEPDERSGVLVAADLTPAQAAILDAGRVAAVVLAFGSPTAHSSILTRARGIPTVVGAGAAVLQIADGTPLAVDGTTGELVIDPPFQVLAAFRRRAATAELRRRQAAARTDLPATTQDGVEVLVGANVGSMDDARAAHAMGADLIGLVRTEFLFLNRTRAPDVAEQEAVYRALAEQFNGRRITLRTLDVGGDKPLGYLPTRAEANPFLGLRGIRLALQRPRLLADQLLAIVRTAHDVPVSVLFPMVSTLAELISARRFLDDAITQTGLGDPAGLQVGIMIEVPAAALKAAIFAPHVDFLSIGTNDLTQYALAAERGNDAVATLGDALDPGVLRLIDATCRGAGPQTPVAVCGELAADEHAARILVGLGVRELSVTPSAVPGVKQAVRSLVLPEAEALARLALDAPAADAVRELLARPARFEPGGC